VVEDLGVTRIKRGFRPMEATLTCGVLFEADPVWLWSLRPNSWASIYITGDDVTILRRKHPELLTRLSSKIVIIASTFEAVYPSVCPDVMWVSGQRGYLDMVSLGKGATHVYWLSHCSRRCPTNTRSINWTKILHRNVGGVTESRGTFGIDSRSTPLNLEKVLHR
jgi:hypothetical protein